MNDSPEQATHEEMEEPPPFLRTWQRLYGLVICYLLVLIAGFYLFARALAP